MAAHHGGHHVRAPLIALQRRDACHGPRPRQVTHKHAQAERQHQRSGYQQNRGQGRAAAPARAARARLGPGRAHDAERGRGAAAIGLQLGVETIPAPARKRPERRFSRLPWTMAQRPAAAVGNSGACTRLLSAPLEHRASSNTSCIQRKRTTLCRLRGTRRRGRSHVASPPQTLSAWRRACRRARAWKRWPPPRPPPARPERNRTLNRAFKCRP